MFELSVAGISAKLQEWMGAAETKRLERTLNTWEVAEPLLLPFLWKPKLYSCTVPELQL